MLRSSLLLALAFTALQPLADEGRKSRKPWSDSPHGPMLERIIPPGFTPAMLPEPQSAGARLTRRYCVQCHHLANPAMHDAARWPGVIHRMVPRMEGKGNMGRLMAEMMAGVEAPGPADTETIVAYHVKHAQTALDPARYPEVNAPSGEAFRVACSQCHVLPDPRRHAAKQWPAVVDRMYRYMDTVNRPVSGKPVPGEPQLRIEDINAFLVRNARR